MPALYFCTGIAFATFTQYCLFRAKFNDNITCLSIKISEVVNTGNADLGYHKDVCIMNAMKHLKGEYWNLHNT